MFDVFLPLLIFHDMVARSYEIRLSKEEGFKNGSSKFSQNHIVLQRLLRFLDFVFYMTLKTFGTINPSEEETTKFLKKYI